MRHLLAIAVLGGIVVYGGHVQAASPQENCFNLRGPHNGKAYPCIVPDEAEIETSMRNGRIGHLTLTGPDGSICRVYFRAGKHHTVSVSSPDGCAFINPEVPQK